MARDGALRVVTWLVAATLPTGLGGCKIVKNGANGAPPPPAAAADPSSRAAALWGPRVMPYLRGRAEAYPALQAAIASDPNAAGRAHGYRPSSDQPWVMVTRLEGTIKDVDTTTLASTITVVPDGDPTGSVLVQIGPVIRGSALRDSLPFAGFNSFENQITYAEFGKALNHHVRDAVLKGFPRDGLVGRHLSALGVFALPSTGTGVTITPAAITPAAITLGPKP